MVVLLERLPDIPVMVTVQEPAAAAPDAVKVTLRDGELAELHVAVTPVGRPDADNATVPLKPFSG